MSDTLRSPSLQSIDRFMSGSEPESEAFLDEHSAEPLAASKEASQSDFVPGPAIHPESDLFNHPWFFFEDGSLTLIAETTKYLVHGSLFRAHSGYWQKKISGALLDRPPEVLQDVSASELESLLSILYPTSFSPEGVWHLLSGRKRGSELVERNWTAVLRLGAMWSFDGIRALAVNQLATIVSPIKKIELSYAYDIPEWRVPAYVALCLREESLSKEESEGIPAESVTRIAAVRAAIQDGRILATEDALTACMISGDIPEFLPHPVSPLVRPKSVSRLIPAEAATETANTSESKPSIPAQALRLPARIQAQPTQPPVSHREQCSCDSFELCSDAVMDAHKDEVWNLAWSHDGRRLATASLDKSAILWNVDKGEDGRTIATCELVLDNHAYAVNCISWSPDDKMLVTASEQVIQIWNTENGSCTPTSNEPHVDVVTALVWLADGSGFLSGSQDQRIICWAPDGQMHEDWDLTPIRITDLALTENSSRLVASGELLTAVSVNDRGKIDSRREYQVIVYDVATKTANYAISLEYQLTSVVISEDSRYMLLSRAPDGVLLWDLDNKHLVREFYGHQQHEHVIRSCFGGEEESFVMSGSEDGRLYVWHRACGQVLDALEGHGPGIVNAVRSNPVNRRLFASVGDDHTVRIWRTVRNE